MAAIVPSVMINGTNDGTNQLFAVQAESLKKQMVGTYHCYEIENENDEEDLDSSKNDDYKGSGLIPDIITDDLFRYFNISETNWHPYYDYKKSVPNIRRSYLLATNKDNGYGPLRKDDKYKIFGNLAMPTNQVHDLTVLRRVIKQGPIMEAKASILPLIIIFTMINIMLLCVYFFVDKNKFPEIVIWLVMGLTNFVLVFKLGFIWYNINHSLKNEGLNNWRKLRGEVADATDNQAGLPAIDTALENLNQHIPEFQGQMSGQPSVSFGSEVLSGVMSGIIKNLFGKPTN